MASRRHSSISRPTLLLACALLLAPLISAQLAVSEDGNCGAGFSQTCLGSRYGNCCSGKGYCGSTVEYCGADCQSAFGTCTSASSEQISANGNCGATDPEKQICVGSTYGDSCSKNGYCGSGSDFAGAGCQPDYGSCDGGSSGSSNTTSSSTPLTKTASPSTANPNSTPSSLSPTSPSAAAQTDPSNPTPTTPSSPTTDQAPAPSGSTLSTGAKAGISIAAIGCAGLIGSALFIFLRRRRQHAATATSNADQEYHKHGGDTQPPSSSSTVLSPVSTLTPDSASRGFYAGVVHEKGHAKDQVVELPYDAYKVAEMDSGQGTHGSELSAEKDSDRPGLSAVSELPTERWSRDMTR